MGNKCASNFLSTASPLTGFLPETVDVSPSEPLLCDSTLLDASMLHHCPCNYHWVAKSSIPSDSWDTLVAWSESSIHRQDLVLLTQI